MSVLRNKRSRWAVECVVHLFNRNRILQMDRVFSFFNSAIVHSISPISHFAILLDLAGPYSHSSALRSGLPASCLTLSPSTVQIQTF